MCPPGATKLHVAPLCWRTACALQLVLRCGLLPWHASLCRCGQECAQLDSRQVSRLVQVYAGTRAEQQRLVTQRRRLLDQLKVSADSVCLLHACC